MEAEVPKIRVVVDAFPSGDAWKKRIHHNQFFCLRRKLRRVGVRHHQADIVPHNSGFADSERACQFVNSEGCRLHIEALGRNR